MRKILCLFLTACILLICVSCTTQENASQNPSQPTVSREQSQESSQPESGEDGRDTVFVENELIAKIDAALTGTAPDRTLLAKNVFADASYRYNIEPESSYSDSNHTKLNDGVCRNLFDQYSWVGFLGSTVPVVCFDLGRQEHNLADVEINMLRQVDYGIELPASVTLSVSDDGESFTKISTLQSPDDVGEGSRFVFRFALPKTVSARYIQISFARKSNGFIFFDEITGYEYCKDGTIDPSRQDSTGDADLVWDYYGYTLNTQVSVPVDSTDSDYNTRQNLALLSGVAVQAMHFDPFEPTHLNSNSPASELARLADGTFAAKATYGDAAFVKFYRGKGRHIIIDLGNEMAVDAVKMEFLNQVTAGVAVPPSIMVSVSNDGESWITTYGGTTVEYGSKTVENVLVDATFKQACRARYIRISFCTVPFNDISSNVYLSEIEVWGKKNSQGVPEAQDDPTIVQGRYPDISDFETNNLFLAAIRGGTAEDPSGNLTVQNALEHIAYVDRDGTIKDTFFDSILLAPSVRFPFTGDVKTDADIFRQDAFAQDLNLRAWDKATAMVQEAIPGTPNTTVWLNLMCPNVGKTCSDVDGDGKGEDFSTAKGRLAYLKYQVDEYLKAWEDAGLKNVKLLGFYWNNEYIDKNHLALEKETIKGIADYIHSKGYMLCWCPYYSAYGIWLWQELGFDFACLQPNYMFYVTEPTRLSNTADIALIYGMCVELEIEVVTGQGSVDRYREYLRQGYDSGYMNSIKMYYVSGVPSALNAACTHDTQLARSVYDDTYLFAKEKLDDNYNTGTAMGLDHFGDISLEVKHGRGVEFNLGDTEGYTVRIMESTVYGTFKLHLSGEGYYRAMKNFRGEDRVVLEISDSAGNKKTVTITVTVTEE